jgi:hypothetical protein
MTEARGNWETARGNWEPERNILGWKREPSERACRWCRRDLMHTKAEHDAVYPADRAAQLAHDREETERQVEADNKILRDLAAKGLTEDEITDEFWRMASRGEGLIDPRPRP